MSKQGAANEGKKPVSGAPTNEGSGAPKAQQQQSAPPSGGKNVGGKVGCHAIGCKDKDQRFNFCDEHFRQFKFGLITKTGEKVVDYERKLEHYQSWLKAQRVA